MSLRRSAILAAALASLGSSVWLACNALSIPAPNGSGPVNPAPSLLITPPPYVSQNRLDAARTLQPGTAILFDLLQQDLLDCTERRCDPLGMDPFPPFVGPCPFNPNTRWTSRINGPVFLTVDTFANSEYNFAFASATGETEYILGLRAPNPTPPFSLLEVNIRAVNPRAYAHVPGNDYLIHEADFPSNDDDFAARSLLDLDPLTGGDVAILVQGVNFAVPPGITKSTAFMNGLGPTAWLAFMRDNAYQSGRFYALDGARKGGPVAFADVPPPGPPEQGLFQSAQVTGDQFDDRSEPRNHLDPDPFVSKICDGDPTPGKPYAFLDRSNIDELGLAAPGNGGFLFVMRQEAFRPGGILAGVVLDPSGPPAAILPGDTIPAPVSGYDEFFLSLAGVIQVGGHVTNHTIAGPPIMGDGDPGVHELSVSIFFVHN